MAIRRNTQGTWVAKRAILHSRFDLWPTNMAQGQGGLRKIGFGQCGLILESRLGVVVLKLCKAGYSDGLWNDCLAHSRVAEAFRVRHSDRPDVLIPRIYAWVAQEDSAWWADHSEVIPRKKGMFRSLIQSQGINYVWTDGSRVPSAIQGFDHRTDPTVALCV